MKRIWGVLCLCLCSLGIVAQVDPVVMSINGHKISRSEFENSYIQYQIESGNSLSPKEYVSHFLQEWLKVEAAKEMGLDTTWTFRTRHEKMRRQLLETYLVDTMWVDSCLRTQYKGAKKNKQRVQVMQVFRKLPQNMSISRIEQVKAQMDSLYQEIQRRPDVDFLHWVNAYSEDKEVRWLAPLQTTVEFENVISSLAVGEVSVPFYTPAGLHIVKVVSRQDVSFEERIVSDRKIWMRNGWLSEPMVTQLVDRLKKQGDFQLNSKGIKELLSKGWTDSILFTIRGRDFDGNEFKQFALAHPMALKRQLSDFITKSLLDEAADHMEECSESARRALRVSDQVYLVQEVTKLQVDEPAANDRVGLAAYFEVHRSRYRWECPRYKGAVLHCVDKKTSKRLRKLLKKLPFEAWKEAVDHELASSRANGAKMEQGTWSIGENPYIDKLVFKQGEFQPILSYPFTIVVGKKQKEPEGYWEVAERVKKDYRTFLYTCWMKELKAAGRVEVISDVLKTVNNN